MRTFTLLANGQDLDTGTYEYFPYADQVIKDFKTPYRIISSLKKGVNVPNADDYVYAKYCVGDNETNKKAIEAAYKASQKFRYFPVSIRRKILGDIHKNLLERKEELLNLFVIEGHPRKLCEWEFSGMEKAYRPESLNFFKSELWREIGRKSNETMYMVRKPDGVVCISPPKNAPCSNSLTAGFALLGGNTLIVKPPLRTPLATIFLWKEIVWKAAKDNGAPDGTINIVIGNSKKITDEWMGSPLINDIIYFGPSEKGLEIGKNIFLAGKKPILELSGNDMLFVWKDADIENAINSLLDAFLGSTQICMVPKAAIIHESIYDRFLKKFSDELKKMKVGLPSEPRTCLTPVMMMKEFNEFLEDALNKGAKLVQGGERVNYDGNKDERGVFINPAIVSIEGSDKALEMKVVREENFFPLLPLVKVRGSSDEDIFKKMITMANSNEYGLRTSLWVRSSLYTRKFIRYLHNSGLIRINSRHVDFSLFLSTHGGTGKTGGPYGEMNYIWQKTTHLQGISLTRDKIPGTK
ncbi:MAG: aldehyde dehydrogenase [Candidatus Omnitrophota bacterium]